MNHENLEVCSARGVYIPLSIFSPIFMLEACLDSPTEGDPGFEMNNRARENEPPLLART